MTQTYTKLDVKSGIQQSLSLFRQLNQTNYILLNGIIVVSRLTLDKHWNQFELSFATYSIVNNYYFRLTFHKSL